MTLCTAWIRKAENTEELVFATDSKLNGAGERWDKGIKLFELPNKDGLLCFTGSTFRAYPLILNLASTITNDERFKKSYVSIADHVEHICLLFSELVKSISDYVEDKHMLRGEARFLFGGWDWKKGCFRIWMILYNPDNEVFEASELTDDEDRVNFYLFIGESSHTDEEDFDVETFAEEALTRNLIEKGRLHNALNMEPLEVLRESALDNKIEGVGGSLQIAKIYRSNTSEFFGIIWPSSKGYPHFQGRKYKKSERPAVQYFDCDTLEILDLEIPDIVMDITTERFKEDFDLVQKCYPDGILDKTISDHQKHSLKMVFKDVAYQEYLENQSKQQVQESSIINEEE